METLLHVCLFLTIVCDVDPSVCHRQHFLQCPPGMLGKHFEKLMQCDPRLQFLSRQPEIVLDSPYFEPRATATEDRDPSHEFDANNMARPPIFGLQDPTTSSSSSKTEHDFLSSAPPETYSSEITSPTSGYYISLALVWVEEMR